MNAIASSSYKNNKTAIGQSKKMEKKEEERRKNRVEAASLVVQ